MKIYKLIISQNFRSKLSHINKIKSTWDPEIVECETGLDILLTLSNYSNKYNERKQL